jgi:putative membrane protein
MPLKEGQKPILIYLLSVLAVFTAVFIYQENYEFIFYIGVILFFFALILLTNNRVEYPKDVLWGLAAWATMHMAGGGVYIGGRKLYEIVLIPIIGEPYNIFKYDQLVHMVGFGVATCLMYALLKPHLKPKLDKLVAVSIVVVMAGLGVGALNEIIEFFAVVVMPSTGVGGYENTALDLVANLVGAVFAVAWIRYQRKS